MSPNEVSSIDHIKMEGAVNTIHTNLALTRISGTSHSTTSFIQKGERLITDVMGSEIVQIYIGTDKIEFTIHKQLLLDAGHIFSDMFPPGRKSTERVNLAKEEPHVFKLFVEYLYTKSVPKVHADLRSPANNKRLHDLCQLYAFVDKFQLEVEICNKVMDAVQDGFSFLNKLPDPALVTAVYQHTSNGSKLRLFCIASLLFSMTICDDLNPDMLAVFMADNRDALRDFMHAVKNLDILGRDPRIRDCQDEEGCIECMNGAQISKDKHGAWPCQYHIHPPVQVKAEGGSFGSGMDADEGCYLWVGRLGKEG